MTTVTPTDDRTTTTPAATMIGLAAPSEGSTEISTWRVEMQADSPSPEHSIDREQVWMPISGSFLFTIEGIETSVPAGAAVIVPADAVRRFVADGGPAEALVCMPAGGTAGLPGGGRQPLPWAS
ncbi:cupin [Patulibacter sp. NPDC049589]|uniref:cupin domain-containing protein n=1 Tax=Patulibacter sp. NPDC049589 TaxID=3154731 RepID=UPI0034256E56